MSKIILSSVGSIQQNPTTAQTEINSNFSTIQTAFDNTLSRDGTSPNPMGADLDMNNQRILNLPAPITITEPLRLSDLNSFIGGGTIQSIPAGGTTGQGLVNNSNQNYDASWNNTVTSVGLSLPADFTITNSPVLTTGTLTATFANTPTGTGGFVRQTSPTLVTPTLGVASATSINKVILTAPATSATLTIANGKTLTANNSITLAGTDATTMTFPGSNATLGGLGINQTWTGSNSFSNLVNFTSTFQINSVAQTFPTSGLLVGTTDSQTLTNKTLTSSTLNGASIDNNAWSTYTPTVTSGSGTFTTVSATGRFKQIGKTVHLQVVVTITTAGTAASTLIATLPVNALASTPATGAARETALTGTFGPAFILTADSTKINAVPSGGGTFIANGNIVCMHITYESV